MLLRDGRIEQQGSPLELFEKPATGFVAGFLGSPTINLIPAELRKSGRRIAVALPTGEALELPQGRIPDAAADGKKILFGIRPQHLARAGSGALGPGYVRVKAVADLIQPTGTRTYVTSRIGNVAVTAELGAHDVHELEAEFDYSVDMNRCVLIDPETDKVL